MLLSLQSAPSVTAVSLAEAKAHLRVEHTDEDTLIGNLIKVCTDEMQGRQGVTRRALITQTWDMWLPGFPACRRIELPMPPLQSVTYIKYYGLDNVEATLDAAKYEVLTEAFVGEILLNYLSSWPSTYERAKAVNIRFVCGYGAAGSNVPENIRQAMLLRIGELYAGRGDDEAPSAAAAIKRLLGPSSVVRLK